MGRKILLIEDDGETAGYIAKGLAEQGHVVDHAADGREGLFLASDAGYDLIILDRMLPGLDGLAIVRAMRAAMKNGGVNPDQIAPCAPRACRRRS